VDKPVNNDDNITCIMEVSGHLVPN